jgi:V8-like Glu-specific endopeptidase
MRAAADSIAMVTRMVDTRAIRETDTRAGERTAAVAAGTAEDRTAVLTAGETPSRGCCFARLFTDASYLMCCIFFKKKNFVKNPGYLL